jgi:lipopolysaccharide transport system permease protein
MRRLDLLLHLVHRRVLDRYIGSTSVVLWMLVSPLIPLLVNILIFYFVARIPEIQSMGLLGYAAFAFSGLIPFRILQRAVTEGGDLLVSNLEMLRSVNFPLAYLSLASVGSLMVDLTMQLLLMAALLIWSGHGVSLSLFALPGAMAILFLLCVGSSWLASIAGYLAREVQELLTLVLTLLLYLSPAVYPLGAAPKALQPIIELNPLSHVVIVFRDVLLSSGSFHWASWLYAVTLAGATFAAGWFAIAKVRRFAGDLV